MKRPSFQFYPADWMADLKLRRCSAAARGVWVDILCALHDSDDGYGLLRWPVREIANTVGASQKNVRELVEKGVLQGSDSELVEPLIYVPRSGRKTGPPVILIEAQKGPIWYSRRLVKDEYVRTNRATYGQFQTGGTDPETGEPYRASKPPKGDGSSSSSPSPSTEIRQESDLSVGGTSRAGSENPAPTAYGEIAKALRGAGIMASPGHQRLRMLVDAGATAEEFLAYVDHAKDKRNPFAYVLGAVEGERIKAKQTAERVQRGPVPVEGRKETTAERRARGLKNLIGDQHHDDDRSDDDRTIEAVSRVIG